MPNGIIKMLYSGKEDQQFTQNPDINFFRSVYKSYSNFVKIPENIQVETNYNILENAHRVWQSYGSTLLRLPPPGSLRETTHRQRQAHHLV